MDVSDDGYEPVRRDERARRVPPESRAVGQGTEPAAQKVPAPPPLPTATPTPRAVHATVKTPPREGRAAG
ncbi:MAG: hypothetical protein J2P24_01610 [Streptosporangiales bacterium]|nr:hypothetical protein [Streptosporangiales bacterium]MBO0890317.1 hypothetical protein [Acidothermales bacterium]